MYSKYAIGGHFSNNKLSADSNVSYPNKKMLDSLGQAK